MTETKDGNFGRSRFEVVYRRSYITEEEFSARGGSDDQYIWMDPSRWNLVLSPLQGRRVALIGNTPILGCGQVIDLFDEVIRMNRMEYWRHSAADDGARITVWGGAAAEQGTLRRGIEAQSPTGFGPTFQALRWCPGHSGP